MKQIVLIAAIVIAGLFFYIHVFTPKEVEYTNVSTDEVVDKQEGFEIKETVQWPLPGSAPERDVSHTIPLEEIKQGCYRQDCIPSVDEPQFVSPEKLVGVLNPESIGISLVYKGVKRFYPFPMLETHELVNDTVAGDPVLVSYCPLCGTGIVFERTLDGNPMEFGVSGMLWQSNLLMYNRAEQLADRNLWSQVLGQAVVGERAGQELSIIPSDIVRFDDWRNQYPHGEVLTTGVPRDPYGGAYYEVAQRFEPDFENTEALQADEYVYGVVVDGVPKAYPRRILPEGEIQDMIQGVPVTIIHEDGRVVFADADGNQIADIEGFWFSWKSAHPETLVWKKQ